MEMNYLEVAKSHLTMVEATLHPESSLLLMHGAFHIKEAVKCCVIYVLAGASIDFRVSDSLFLLVNKLPSDVEQKLNEIFINVSNIYPYDYNKFYCGSTTVNYDEVFILNCMANLFYEYVIDRESTILSI